MSRAAKASTVLSLFVLISFLALAPAVWAQVTPTVTLPSSSSSVLGVSASFTATVTDGTSSGNSLTGIVQFSENGAVIGSAATTGTANSTSATFSTSILARGAHAITAEYFPDAAAAAHFNPSAPSNQDTHTVNVRATNTAIAALTPVTVRSAAPVPVAVADIDNGSSAGTFAPNSGDVTPNLVTGRNAHTATLLPNGTVLVVGGNGIPALTSPEIYTPGSGFANCPITVCSGTFTARQGATATLLQDGTVLIVGGSSDNTATNALQSAEIYNPFLDCIESPIPSSGAETRSSASKIVAP